MQTTIYIAATETGGHYFEAVDIMPSLARSRLFRELEAFKGGDSLECSRAVDNATIREVKAGAFVRSDANEKTPSAYDTGLECFAMLAPDVADTAGRFLWAIAEHGLAGDCETRAAIREAGEALLALGNDSQAILCAYTFNADGTHKESV